MNANWVVNHKSRLWVLIDQECLAWHFCVKKTLAKFTILVFKAEIRRAREKLLYANMWMNIKNVETKQENSWANSNDKLAWFITIECNIYLIMALVAHEIDNGLWFRTQLFERLKLGKQWELVVLASISSAGATVELSKTERSMKYFHRVHSNKIFRSAGQPQLHSRKRHCIFFQSNTCGWSHAQAIILNSFVRMKTVPKVVFVVDRKYCYASSYIFVIVSCFAPNSNGKLSS